MNSGHNNFFISKMVLCRVFWQQGENAITLPQSAQRNAFWGEINSKSKKLAPTKKFGLGLFNHRLGHRSTR